MLQSFYSFLFEMGEIEKCESSWQILFTKQSFEFAQKSEREKKVQISCFIFWKMDVSNVDAL